MVRAREVFEASQDFTVGLEEEFAILDPTTRSLEHRFEELRDAAQEDAVLAESVAGELIESEIEIRSGRGEGFGDACARQREAREFCRTCPVRTECLTHVLDHRVEFGVWGGMTERERRALLRSRPEVDSWADLLADAREAHYASTAEESADAMALAAEQDREALHESA